MKAETAPRPEAVLFDLDGTLADTLPDLADALASVAGGAGTGAGPSTGPGTGAGASAGPGSGAGAGLVDETRLRPLISRGGREMIASVLPPDADQGQLDRARRRFLARYRERIAIRTRLFPGIDSVLRTLEGLGVRWGVVTNKHAWLTEPLLESLDLHRRAACVVSGDSAAHPKPHPAPLLLACERLSIAPHAAVYVGDSRSDIESGRAAGVSTVSAGWGYLDPDDPPQRWGADVDIGTPDDLLAWIRHALAER